MEVKHEYEYDGAAAILHNGTNEQTKLCNKNS